VLSVGPSLFYVWSATEWIGFFFLGIFMTVLGIFGGTAFLFYGGPLPEVRSPGWVTQKSSSTWLQYGGPTAASGLGTLTKQNDKPRESE
jgi:hypothetical protein